MINAYKNFFKGYVDFTGRSTRSEYWWKDYKKDYK